MHPFINTARQRIAAFIDPGRIDALTSTVATMSGELARMRARNYSLEDTLARINENARNGSLPEGKFVQVDYGRGGLSRETVITADAVKHPNSGLSFVADGDRVVVQDAVKRPLFVLTQEKLTWPNGLAAPIGPKRVVAF